MTDQDQPQMDTIYSSYDKNLYRLSADESESDQIFDALGGEGNSNASANNSSAVTVDPANVGSGISNNTTNAATGNDNAGGKATFDNTTPGYILGVDPKDGIAKFYIGNTSSYLNWDGSTLTVVGNVNISNLNIPDSTTANSFHVDSSGNAWWGTNLATGYTTAPASILNTGVAKFSNITITGGSVGGFTITASAMYAGIISTAATVGVGHTGVIMDTAGLRGYDSVLGETFNLPTNGSAPTFASGIINSTVFNVNTSATIQTSSTVGDGSSSSAGILMNNTGFYGVAANQLLAAANVRILVDGSAYFSGTFNLGGTLVTVSDITKLQTTINTISALGGGTVSLVPNTYTPAANTVFTIPSNVTIDGNGSTIDFGASAGQFLIQGTNAYSTGTVSVNYGSSTVTGVGTTWTVGMVGQSILIGDYWYTITARASNTSISISYSPGNGFIGTSVSGVTYVIATTVNAPVLQNIVLTNSTTATIKFQYVNGFNMNTVVITSSAQAIQGNNSANINLQTDYNIDGCVTGIIYNNVPFCTFISGLISNITGGSALDLTGVTNTALNSLSIQGVTGVGTKFTNCHNFGYEAFSTIECTSHGIELVSGNNDVDFLSGYVNTCGGDGIKFTASSNRSTIVATSILNCTGFGVNIASSSDNNNQIIAPAFSNNTAGNINDSGTGTFISPQTLSTFIVQDIALNSGRATTGYSNDFAVTSNLTGSVLYIASNQAGNVTIYRLANNTVTNNYQITHTTTLTVQGGGDLENIIATSTFLYVVCQIASNAAVRRYSLADLSGVTTITGLSNGDFGAAAFTDGTNFYFYNTTDTFTKYTISGTVLTGGTTFTYTGAGTTIHTAWCDGTSVWMSSTAAAGTFNIKKYLLAGGAATSTTSPIINSTNYYQGTMPYLFAGGAGILGLGWGFGWTSPTAQTGDGVHLTAIALP